jgi:mono/diheme cytochrome c family protein
VGNHNSISRKLFLGAAYRYFSLTSFAQEAAAAAAAAATAAPAATTGGDAVKVKLFNANCAACHKLDAKATGPMLEVLLLSMKWHGFTSG